MAEFVFPSEWGDAPPPPSPDVDPDRIEGLQNGFLAATQEALHTAPDAFYRTTGQDAVDGAPALQQRLAQMRDDALAQAKDDNERAALAPRLDANLTYIQGGIDRHVAEQKLLRNRQIAEERQALNLRLAELEHGDDSILPSIAEANASVAQHLARLRSEPEEPAMLAARSAVWRNAIDQRLANGQSAAALDLFGRIQDQLAPVDQRTLKVPIQTARSDVTSDQWIAREAAKPGEPLVTRVQADTQLSPAEKTLVLAKVEAKDSAREAARVATVKGLDDQLEATAHSIATAPGSYKPGTLAALANAYEDAGESAKAGPLRQLAQQESFVLSFAQTGAAAQQRLIESLPEGDARAAAEAIQDRQAETFAKDAFSAGAALYPDVGPAKPIDDMAGRVAQARTIAAYRGVSVVPFRQRNNQLQFFVLSAHSQDEKEWDDLNYLVREMLEVKEEALDKLEPGTKHKIEHTIEHGPSAPRASGYRELMSDRVFKKIAKKHAPYLYGERQLSLRLLAELEMYWRERMRSEHGQVTEEDGILWMHPSRESIEEVGTPVLANIAKLRRIVDPTHLH